MPAVAAGFIGGDYCRAVGDDAGMLYSLECSDEALETPDHLVGLATPEEDTSVGVDAKAEGELQISLSNASLLAACLCVAGPVGGHLHSLRSDIYVGGGLPSP